jgi:protein-S-isoprenylcysteine O-methyltransferase Ste14
MKLIFRIIRSTVYVPLFILFFWWIAQSVRVFDVQIGVIIPEWTKTIGLILMVTGGSIALICVVTFILIGKGTPAPFDPPREFVAKGPYAYVRNPMYVGGIILLAGFGLYQHSPSIVILTILLFGIVHSLVILYEEPTLEQMFGKSYTEYKRHTNRWIPKFRTELRHVDKYK